MSIPSGFRELTEASGFAAANGPWFEKVEGNRVWRGFRPGPQHANALGIVHGGMLAVSLLVLAIRHNQWSVRRLLPPRPSRATQTQGGQPA